MADETAPSKQVRSQKSRRSSLISQGVKAIKPRSRALLAFEKLALYAVHWLYSLILREAFFFLFLSTFFRKTHKLRHQNQKNIRISHLASELKNVLAANATRTQNVGYARPL
jgi:hypothetical protein